MPDEWNVIMSWRALAFLVSCLPGSLAFAQECADYRDLPVIRTGPFELGEAPRLIAATDSAVCWSVGSVLVWCPLDGDQPDLANAVRCTVAATPASLRLDGARAAVTTSGGGWRIIDFTAPGAPVIAGMVEDGAGCRDADVQGNWVVAVEETGLALYELHPDGSVQERFRGQPDCTGEHHSSRTMSADIAGDRCWTEAYFLHETGGDGFVIAFDLADPASPTEIGRALASRNSGDGGTEWQRIQASRAGAVLQGSYHHSGPSPGDQSDSYLARFFAEESGDIASVYEQWDEGLAAVGLSGSGAYVMNGWSVTRYAQDGADWREVDLVAGGGQRLAASPSGAWIVQGTSLYRLRCVTAGWPALRAAYRPLEYARTMECRDGHVFLLENNGHAGAWPVPVTEVAVLDAADPLRLVRRGSVARAVDDGTLNAVVHGDHVYTRRGIWNWRTLALAGPWTRSPIGIVGGTLWTPGVPGVEIHGLADPSAPSLIGSCFPGETVSRLVASGERAVLVADGKLITADVARPGAPVTLAEHVCSTADINALALDGGRLLVARGSGLSVHALAADGTLIVVGELDGIDLRGLVTDGQLAYASTPDGLAVIDVGTPTSPVLVGEFATIVPPLDVKVAGEILYLNDGRLRALRRQCPLSVGVELGGFAVSWRGTTPCLSWSLNGSFLELRLLATTSGHQRVVPWRQEDGRYVAVDPGAMPGQVVEYALQSRMGAAWITLASEVVRVPAAFTHLDDPRPNPFNPRTEIRFTLERDGIVSLTIHDLAGRCLRTLIEGARERGAHVAPWDGTDDRGLPVGAGGYVARLRTDREVLQVKLMLVK